MSRAIIANLLYLTLIAGGADTDDASKVNADSIQAQNSRRGNLDHFTEYGPNYPNPF